MDTTNSSVGSVRRRTPTKRRKPDKDKENAIKVVYISNPMKFSASTAAEFMALVQEFTGRDAESPPDPSRFRDFGGGGHQTDNSETQSNGGGTTATAQVVVEANKDYNWDEEGQIGSSTMEWFEAFDDVDVFASQIVDNVSSFFESSKADHHQVLHAV